MKRRRPAWLDRPRNPIALLPPSQRLIAAARAAGVQGGATAIKAWSIATNWTGVKVR